MKSENELAILGGQPVRTKPYLIRPWTDSEEENMVLEAIRNDQFSLFVGSTSPGVQEALIMKSRQTRGIQATWHYLGGHNIRNFGADFADWLGVDFAIPINSATSGISVALASCGVGPGDEVIVPALSFTATATAILMFNSVPVFVDVDPRTFCIDPEKIERAITPRTKAILIVHLMGGACEIDSILAIAKKYSLKVIEDCAQSIGVRYKGRYVGTFGDAGVFSFQQSKNIMTGEGGMITTQNSEIAKKARLILNHGEAIMENHDSDGSLTNIVGMNFRMTELSAALGRAQLKKLAQVNEWRNRNFQHLVSRLSGIIGLSTPYIPESVEYVCHIAAFLYDSSLIGVPRDLFVEALRAEGIPVGTGYMRPLYENPIFLRKVAYGRGGCPWVCGKEPNPVKYEVGQAPVTEKLLKEQFLWFYFIAYPSTVEDVEDAARAFHKVLAQKSALLSAFSKEKTQLKYKQSQGWIEKTRPNL